MLHVRCWRQIDRRTARWWHRRGRGRRRCGGTRGGQRCLLRSSKSWARMPAIRHCVAALPCTSLSWMLGRVWPLLVCAARPRRTWPAAATAALAHARRHCAPPALSVAGSYTGRSACSPARAPSLLSPAIPQRVTRDSREDLHPGLSPLPAECAV